MLCGGQKGPSELLLASYALSGGQNRLCTPQAFCALGGDQNRLSELLQDSHALGGVKTDSPNFYKHSTRLAAVKTESVNF